MSECMPLRAGDEFFVHFTDKKREKLRSSSAFKIKYEGVWLTVVHISERKKNRKRITHLLIHGGINL